MKPPPELSNRAGFGTGPVFFTSLCTILGAILFLRMGYSVAHTGFWGTLAIILIGHLVTVPTSMAIAEIATNQRVAGGGAYFIVSRSFGLTIGAAIGVSLYFSQAISIAFYIIAFAEASEPVLQILKDSYGIVVADKRWVSIPTMISLFILMRSKGADLGIKALYVVAVTLFFSILLFFVGSPVVDRPIDMLTLGETIADKDSFFKVFAVCFPAFTGVAAGLGLSGDLKNPFKSIPKGTLWATVVGGIIYIAVAFKLSISATPEMLAGDQLIMGQIALWGPIIPIGLACATLSSALGSMLVAPRTLQAIAKDDLFPSAAINQTLGANNSKNGEPIASLTVTSIIAIGFVCVGDVNIVAEIISMFFMVTYGAICTVSFLEHFAADPSYRPTFRSPWYVSLFGAVVCLWLMIQMSLTYTIVSFALMTALFVLVSHYNPDKRGLAAIFQGVIFQMSRGLQVFLQKSTMDDDADKWRPSVVCISDSSFERFAAFDVLRWISYRYGFGTYIHYINGYLSRETHQESKQALARLIKKADASYSNVFIDTVVSPSYTSAISQMVQLPGVSGKENNLLMFEFSKNQPEKLERIVENYQLVHATDFDTCILASTELGFGYKKEIHIWMTHGDYKKNAVLMILLGFIILGHPEWENGIIKIFALLPQERLEEQRKELTQIIKSGRLPISESNISVISQEEGVSRESLITSKSKDADLVVLGLHGERLKRDGTKVFGGYDDIGNILFVSAAEGKDLTTISEGAEVPETDKEVPVVPEAEASADDS